MDKIEVINFHEQKEINGVKFWYVSFLFQVLSNEEGTFFKFSGLTMPATF